MSDKDRAYWLADKIPAYGDYAKEAAFVLRQQADRIEQLERENDDHVAAIGQLQNDCSKLERENAALLMMAAVVEMTEPSNDTGNGPSRDSGDGPR